MSIGPAVPKTQGYCTFFEARRRHDSKVFRQMTSRLGQPNRVAGNAVRDTRQSAHDLGAAAVEFALVVPMLCTLIFAITTFGITLANYIQLSNGVRAASRVFGSSRGGSTPVTNSITAFSNAAPQLSGVTYSFKTGAPGVAVGSLAACGTTAANDSACASAITTAGVGGTTSVTVTYPTCNLTVMGINYAPSCSLTFTTADIIE